MKKKSIIHSLSRCAALLILACMLIGMCGCDQAGSDCKHIDNNADSACDLCGAAMSKDPGALAVPAVSIDGSGLASWNAVPNAAKYIYKINGGQEQETTATSVQLAPGDSITVKAVPADTKAHKESAYSAAQTFAGDGNYGLPAPALGYYITNADVLQASETERYIVYTTNRESGEEDNVIAIAKGNKTDKGWLYGAGKTILEPNENGWDQYLTSASIVKGSFSYQSESYSYLMAYAATSQADGLAQSIGLAVAKEIDGEYVRIGSEPILAYDKAQYGNNAGFYAPSLVNKNGSSAIGLFYTRADIYGHFLYFTNADMASLDNLSLVGSMITNKGNLSGGDAVTMMPNMDVALGADGYLYAVKDYSPSAAQKPQVATSFEYAKIRLEELATTDDGDGWVSEALYDYLDLDNGHERAYSPCLVSDLFGHMIDTVEIIYNVSDTEAENPDYIFSQELLSITID